MGTATHVDEAQLLEEKGINIIVAQGAEAGGHRGTFIGRAEDALIPLPVLVKECVSSLQVPVISDVGIYELWQAVYMQIHLAFVEKQDKNGRVPFGVSFPEYRYQSKVGGYLGTKLRVFGNSESDLVALNLSGWLSRLMNYMHCSLVREVPTTKVTGYVEYRRRRLKGSIAKLAKRRAKRMSISFGEALKHYQDVIFTSDLPYLQLKSLTNKQPFKLYIAKNESSTMVECGFGTYGMGFGSTVPNF